jgi:hypothetical protein
MADFMVYNKPSGSDTAVQYQRGDIVEVRETGAPRGGMEGLPDFIWLLCPTITKAEVESYMTEVRNPTAPGQIAQLLKRRQYGISESECDAIVAEGGSRTVTEQRLRQMVQNNAP